MYMYYMYIILYYKSKQGKAGHSRQAATFKEKAEHDLNYDL